MNEKDNKKKKSNKSEKINFMTWGERCARGQVACLEQMAKEIEEKYGARARVEFEAGTAYFVSSYAYISCAKQNEVIRDLLSVENEEERFVEHHSSKKYSASVLEEYADDELKYR